MLRGILLGFVASLTGPIWAASGDPGYWLQKMSHAHREISYQAVVTHQVDDQMASYRLVHAIVDGQEYEYLEPLDSRAGQLIRRGHSLNCVHPADQLIRATQASGGPVQRYYDLRISGKGRVAGRETVELEIKPRDVFRLGYLLSLDVDLGLPLRTEIRGTKNEMLERYQYTMLSLGVERVALPARGAEVSHSRPLSVKESDRLLQALKWHPAWVPAGFVLAQGPDEGRDGEALSFTDGLALFTVFLEPLSAGNSGAESAMRHGASLVYSQRFQGAPYRVTVVGEIPVLTARQVAQSIRWTHDQ